MNFLDEIRKNKKEFVKEICELIKIPSVLEESLTQRMLLSENQLESLDYVLNLGKNGVYYENVGNVSGHIEYGEGSEIIGVLCHVDVVPADGKWKYPPLVLPLKKIKIYGRGAQETKD